jgi:hypothetical protein
MNKLQQQNKFEMGGSHLVQRLREPINYENVFAFGGGYKNGGLSDEAFNLLKGVFSFDYMGAAEYEFGAVPKCLKAIAEMRQAYDKWEITVNKTPIYVIGPAPLKEEIIERIIYIANNKGYIKCGCDLNSAVGLNKYCAKDKCRTIGYLELDNNFAFFTKKETSDDFAKLLGIE